MLPTTLNKTEKIVKEKVRLSLDMSPEMNAVLENLVNKTGTTKSEVLRRAVLLMDVIVDGKKRGLKFGFADPDQPLKTEIVGL